eukprot:4277369-Alexandrium_andersonii.AAC.1
MRRPGRAPSCCAQLPDSPPPSLLATASARQLSRRRAASSSQALVSLSGRQARLLRQDAQVRLTGAPGP